MGLGGDDSKQPPNSGGRPIKPNILEFVNLTSDSQSNHSESVKGFQQEDFSKKEKGAGEPNPNGNEGHDPMTLFFPGGVDMDQVLNTINGFNNMAIAHEMAVNDEYRFELPKGDSLRGRVKEQLFNAYWDLIEENLSKEDPDYTFALDLLTNIREALLNLLPPYNKVTRNRINETLDLDLIKQQLDKGVFGISEFKTFAEFILSLLAGMCSPLRDNTVVGLKEILQPSTPRNEESGKGDGKEDQVTPRKVEGDVKAEQNVGMPELLKVYRGILDLLELMKLDMANFNLVQFRPIITQNCVQYEKEKFAACLELKYKVHEDPLHYTRKWLMEYEQGCPPRTTIIKAFCGLLNYDKPILDWPEALTLDLFRFFEMLFKVKKLTIIASTVLAVSSVYQMLYKLPLAENLRLEMLNKFKLIVDFEDLMVPQKVEETMQRLFEQAFVLVNNSLQLQNQNPASPTDKKQFHSAIMDVILPENRVRTLLLRRFLEFTEATMLKENKDVRIEVPPGLLDIKNDVIHLVTQFARLVQHNLRVFGELFQEVIEGKIRPPLEADASSAGELDPSLTEAMRILKGHRLTEKSAQSSAVASGSGDNLD